MSAVAPPRIDFDRDVEDALRNALGPEDFDGWWCVSTAPFPCPAAGCDFVADHMTAAHLILVWPERDDPRLLHHAQIARDVGRNPRVVEYEQGFGKAISYYAWVAIGKPVHAIRGGK